MKSSIKYLLLPIIGLILFGCQGDGDLKQKLDSIEALLESQPQYALSLLTDIPENTHISQSNKARIALLSTTAHMLNNDSVNPEMLKPAIEFYLQKGSIDDKIRTYFAQGQIQLRQGNDDKAMESFLKAVDYKEGSKDTLTLARLMENQGLLYLKQYKVKEAIDKMVEAGQLYGSMGKKGLELRSYSKAINGCVVLSDKYRADSIMAACFPLAAKYPAEGNYLMPAFRAYTVEFGDLSEIKICMTTFDVDKVDNEDIFTYAIGYFKLDQYDEALHALENVTLNGAILDSIRYYSIKQEILDAKGNKEQAYTELKTLSSIKDRHYKSLFSQDLLFADERHQLAIDRMKILRNRDHIIWLLGIGSVILIITLVWWLCHMRQQRRQREIEITVEINKLEEERNHLKDLIAESTRLERPLQEILKTRLDMLNGLLAKEITKNEVHAKQFNKWIETIRKDKITFINSTREGFAASHPNFMEYLVKHELTVEEINYVCLYALGLRGKEVGDYMEIKGHYNISSTIRKKFNLSEHDTNLGIFVRNLLKKG